MFKQGIGEINYTNNLGVSAVKQYYLKIKLVIRQKKVSGIGARGLGLGARG
jgi:hypothetical protein